MKKLAIVIILIVIMGGAFYIRNRGAEKPKENNSEQAVSNTVSEQILDPNLKYYTMEEVSRHGGSKTYEDTQGYETYSCWMVIHAKVYDVTDFIEPHPGGHIIEEGCGTDATEIFETRPQGSGTPHSDQAREMLEKYYIGELKK